MRATSATTSILEAAYRMMPWRVYRRLRETLDERTGFYDVSIQDDSERKPKSNLLQVYSAAPNIGNYTPVLGIQRMIGRCPDVWDAHKKPLDCNFINNNYDCVIVGGAGLFHSVFTPFWEQFYEECHLPYIIWGVGGCFMDDNKTSAVRRPLGAAAMRKADFVNVRDKWTAEYYDMPNASVTACPTLEWLVGARTNRNAKWILYVDHPGLCGRDEHSKIIEVLGKQNRRYRYTDNNQRIDFGLERMVRKLYGGASVVITTRLHGAIIAAGMGIPYIAIARDEKIRAFVNEYGGGVLAEGVDELEKELREERYKQMKVSEKTFYDVREFGEWALHWIDEKSARRNDQKARK